MNRAEKLKRLTVVMNAVTATLKDHDATVTEIYFSLVMMLQIMQNEGKLHNAPEAIQESTRLFLEAVGDKQ